MTSILRIDAVDLDTSEGAVRYEFPSDLTVLAGVTGVGKTTLLEMIKYGLGCTARLAPVAIDHVRDVSVDVTIGNSGAFSPPSRLRITRSIDQKKSRIARITDLVTDERLRDHQTGDGEPSLSNLLLTSLGLPSEMRAAPRSGGSSNAGARITFADVLTFLYVRQAEINHDIAHSQDSYREPKRKAVFELLYGLTNPAVLKMRSDLNAMNAKVTAAEAEYQNVVSFLRTSQTASRTAIEQDIADLQAAEERALAEQATLREEIDPVTDRGTLTIRDLLADAERTLADARDTVTNLDRQQADYSGERRRVQADLDRYRRMLDAGERLASIEFAVCPRCMQALTGRPVPDGACRVCLQRDPVTAGSETEDDLYETRQLREQLTEMDGQLASTATQLAAAYQAVTDREQLVKRLSASVDERTAQRVSPRLQAFSDAVQRHAMARARQKELEHVLRQWDRADDIGGSAEQLRADREQIRSELDRAQTALGNRRSEILGAINEEFRFTVRALGIPGIQTAEIHPTNYLPILNGRPFFEISSGGGIITAVQIAYWTSLLAVALRYPETAYPGLLIIDSPRLALNDQEALPAALYRRLITQADASPGRVQFIIADNQLPAAYRRDYDEIDFTYESPTVSTITHPGPDAVESINN